MKFYCSCGAAMRGTGTLTQAIRTIRAEHLSAGHTEVSVRQAARTRRKQEARP